MGDGTPPVPESNPFLLMMIFKRAHRWVMIHSTFVLATQEEDVMMAL
jgi:hypothetical protein